jgi:hypothetical protein
LGIVAIALLPLLGLFTTTKIFYVRDLSFFFWSRHLWLRHTIFAGHAPWWDPYVAAGQSAIADALNQLMMPVALAVRLLPSDVVSFNLWVALPLPIAALGMFVFLRRRFAMGDDAAAAFGACVFALSGPIVSTLNLPNLSWSVAFIPWVLAARSVPGVAVAFGLQALCGEPVTWVATGVLAVASAFRRNPRVLAALPLGGLLAAVQLVPTLLASVRAHRSTIATPDFWSLHPLALWEALAPNLFGNYFDAFLGDLPWMGALNFGRDPFLYSIYVGPLVLLLACAGASRFRRNWLWAAVAVVSVVAAFGGYTPLYPWLRTIVPQLMYFRFPAKYIVFAAFAVAVLAAEGWKELKGLPHEDGSHGRVMVWLPALAGSLTLLVTLALMAAPGTLRDGAYSLAIATHLKEPAAGAEALARTAPPLALRAGAMLVAAALLAGLARRRPYAVWVLAGVACADLLAVNGGLNPTTAVAKLSPPSWFTAAAGPQRLYIGGRVRGYMNGGDADGVGTWQIPAEATAIEGRMVLNAELPLAPSGWRVREALSYDLPFLWPAQYDAAVKRFEQASRDERDAFLRRGGVRWCVVPDSQQRPWRAIAPVSDWNMRVFECHPEASRLAFAAHPGDLEALFDPRLPDSEASGEARIVDDAPGRVVVEATASRDTFLVLRDSYDPSWRAEVDGRPAPIVPAFGIQRGVALSPGRHVVRFSYRPRDLFVGLTLSVVALLLIAGFKGFEGFKGFKRFKR